MPQQPLTYTLGGYQSRRCLPLSVPFGGQDFRNGRDRCCTSCTKCALKGMGITVTLSQFRSEQSHYLDAAQREPVTILSCGPRRRAVMVSPDFYDRAVQALEDGEDIRAAAAARQEAGGVSHEEFTSDLELD